MKLKQSICDYSNYDYENEFWEKANRDYENKTEQATLRQLLTQWGKDKTTICDAGCGFGRLAPIYLPLFKHSVFVDYAEHLLDRVRNRYGDQDVSIYRQSLYELKLPEPVDVMVSIRTLHHLDNTSALFKQFYKNLKDNGMLILDIPNHFHIKNRIKNPLETRNNKIKKSEAYHTYDPRYIIEKLEENGFNIVDTKQVGIFRIKFIKSILKADHLVYIERLMNKWISNHYIAPSVYVVAKKCG